jgi:hypothetical protein
MKMFCFLMFLFAVITYQAACLHDIKYNVECLNYQIKNYEKDAACVREYFKDCVPKINLSVDN